MSRHFGVFLAMALGGLVGCAPQAISVDHEAELASLVAADARYAEVGSTFDLEGMMELYDSDAIMYPPETAPITGPAALRGMLEAFMADPAGAVSFSPLYAVVSADGDMGYTMSEATMTQTGSDGAAATEHVRDFHVWRKQADGSWRIVVDIWNAAPPTRGES